MANTLIKVCDTHTYAHDNIEFHFFFFKWALIMGSAREGGLEISGHDGLMRNEDSCGFIFFQKCLSVPTLIPMRINGRKSIPINPIPH